ncbi:MAG TPA: hypothetical protein VFU05_16940 [Cyclobacteriaceae bacterium]|nr:hypothetical protein [Cyclobacteriaceae bacterium]
MKVRLLIIFLFVTFPVWSQPGDPSGDPDVPITGIEILIAIGGALGIRKFLQERRKRNS